MTSQFAFEHSLGRVKFDTDCLILVEALCWSDTFEAHLGPVYEYISRHIQELPRPSFYHIDCLGLVQALCSYDSFKTRQALFMRILVGKFRSFQDLLSITFIGRLKKQKLNSP